MEHPRSCEQLAKERQKEKLGSMPEPISGLPRYNPYSLNLKV